MQNNNLARKTSYSLYTRDMETIASLAKTRQLSCSAALRECLPDEVMLATFVKISEMNPGLSYRLFINQMLKQWLISNSEEINLKDVTGRSEEELQNCMGVVHGRGRSERGAY